MLLKFFVVGVCLSVICYPIVVLVWLFSPETAHLGIRIGLALTAIVCVVLTPTFVRGPNIERVGVVLTIFVLLPLFLVCSCVLAKLLSLLHIRHLVEMFLAHSANVQATVILVAGGILFTSRLYLRFAYGLVEVGIGMVVGMQKFGPWPDSSPSNLVHADVIGVLCAGVYLVVRGLDNAYQGLKMRDPDDPVVRLIRRAVGLSGSSAKGT
jgi:hypothetical protein